MWRICGETRPSHSVGQSLCVYVFVCVCMCAHKLLSYVRWLPCEWKCSSQKSWSLVLIDTPCLHLHKWQPYTHRHKPVSCHLSSSLADRLRHFSHWGWHLVLLVNEPAEWIYHGSLLDKFLQSSPQFSSPESCPPDCIYFETEAFLVKNWAPQ